MIDPMKPDMPDRGHVPASDAEIKELRAEAEGTQTTWAANINRDKPNGCWSNTLLIEAPGVLRILNRLAASEKECAELRAKVTTATQGGVDTVGNIDNWQPFWILANFKDSEGEVWHLAYTVPRGDDGDMEIVFPFLDNFREDCESWADDKVVPIYNPTVAVSRAVEKVTAERDEAVGLITKLMYELDAHNTVRCEGSKSMRSEVTGQLIDAARAFLTRVCTDNDKKGGA